VLASSTRGIADAVESGGVSATINPALAAATPAAPTPRKPTDLKARRDDALRWLDTMVTPSLRDHDALSDAAPSDVEAAIYVSPCLNSFAPTKWMLNFADAVEK
jgi:hypothetical protein